MAPSAELCARLRAAALAQMQADPAHDVAHLDRVWANCQRIVAHGASGDLTRLAAAAYLHDLVNLAKDDPDRHLASRRSAKAAQPILEANGFSADQIADIRHAIEAHSFSAGIPPQSGTARILRDADQLDALGAIGIARTLAVNGQLNRPFYDAADPFARRRDLDDQQWGLDHWPDKLLTLPEGLLTDAARQIAKGRIATMLAYLQALADEIGEDLPKAGPSRPTASCEKPEPPHAA